MDNKGKKQGYVLLITLMLCGIAFFLLLVSVSGTIDFSLQKEDMFRDYSLDAAYGTQDKSIAEIIYNPHWHEGYKSGDLKFVDAKSIVVFHSPSPVPSPSSSPSGTPSHNREIMGDDSKTPYSTNNSNSFSPAIGWNNRIIPAGFVHIVTNSESSGIKEIRQALVNPYYQLFFEDFDADGKGSKARNKWNFMSKTKGYLIEDSYLFMGSTKIKKNIEEYATAGDEWWTDYDFISNIAYYGKNPFGLYFRCTDFEGYGFLIIPEVSGEKVIGGVVQICKVTDGGKVWDPFDSQNFTGKKNPFKSDSLPALWYFKASVQDDEAWLTMANNISTKKFDLAKSGNVIKKGSIGFFAERNGTEIGVTRIIVNKRGLAMITIPAQW